MKLPIYLDYAATTPVDPRVAAKMMQCLTPDGVFGNPASTHLFGKAAYEVIETARLQVANLINAQPNEIVFTSGATEANNLALKGAAQLYKSKGKHIVTLKTEHPAVLDCCQQLEKEGFFVTYLAPEPNGLVNLEKLQAALRDDTILVSIMHVNNELGVIQDIQAIGKITSARHILLHVDAAQSAGKIPINLAEMAVDLMSFSGHKVYGPKGVGALFLRRKPRVRVASQMHGGGQEQGMRSGTLATHQIAGMGEAFAIAKNEMELNQKNILELRNYFWQEIATLPGVALNGDFTHSLPNILNVSFAGIRSDKMLQQLADLAISSGSACHSKGVEPSYVLRALGQSEEQAASAVRFSFGKFTTQEEIEFAARYVKEVILPAAKTPR